MTKASFKMTVVSDFRYRPKSFSLFCFQVIQRRQDGSEDFYRNFADYVEGFGKLTGELWLGKVI